MYRSLAAPATCLICVAVLLATVRPLAGQTAGRALRQQNVATATRPGNGSQSTPGMSGQAPVLTRAPFRLTPQQLSHLEKVLKYWEYRSSQVQTYQCSFTRWEYDPVFGPKNPNHAKTISRGVIRYSAPDKGLFRVETMAHYRAPHEPGQPPSYPQAKVQYGEHWVCDGKSVFEFNAKTKQLIETQLPPSMQGKAITDGPLPFMFGAKAEKLKQRYWIREQIPPAGAKEYWLEAYPKTRQDAANFQRVEVILDQQFLPTALQLYPPNYDAKRNPGRTAYKFESRKVNNLVDQVQGFMNSFVRPRLPSGWTRHVEVYGQQSPDSPRVAPARSPGIQARRPTQNRLR